MVDSFPCPICRKLIKTESISLNHTLKNLIGEVLGERVGCIMNCMVIVRGAVEGERWRRPGKIISTQCGL